eukprot:740726_1
MDNTTTPSTEHSFAHFTADSVRRRLPLLDTSTASASKKTRESPQLTQTRTSQSENDLNPSALPDPDNDNDELRQRAELYHRQLLASEDQYVNELETIVKYIAHPLQKAAVRCKIR